MEIIILRLLHIIFGTFWVGSALFLAIILEPQTRALGPAIQRPVMSAVGRVMAPILTASAAISILAGVALVVRLRWGHLDTLFNTGWGWAIIVGSVAALAAFLVGGVSGMTVARMGRLGRAIEGRPPTPEEGARLQGLGGRVTLLARTTAVLLVVAVGAMASARFV